MFAKAYDVLGQGAYGNSKELGDILRTFADGTRGSVTLLNGSDTKMLDVSTSDKGTGSAVSEFTKAAGVTGISDPGMLEPMWQKAPKLLVDVITRMATADTGASGFWSGVGRTVLGVAQTAITGNPLAAFNDPSRAAMAEALGSDGTWLVNSMMNIYRGQYRAALKRRALVSANAVEGTAEAAKVAEGIEAVPESQFNDPAIVAEIRPFMEEVSKFHIKSLLRGRGAIVAEEAGHHRFRGDAVQGFRNTGRQDRRSGEGRVHQEAQGHIVAAITGQMTLDVVGDRVHRHVPQKPERA